METPITFTYHDGTGPGKQGWQSAVRELDPSDSPVVPMASYTLLQQTLWDTNEALAACQSQAAGRIRVLEKEVEELREDAYRYRWLQSDGDHACGLVRDTYSDWDGERETWTEALNIEIDNARSRP